MAKGDPTTLPEQVRILAEQFEQLAGIIGTQDSGLLSRIDELESHVADMQANDSLDDDQAGEPPDTAVDYIEPVAIPGGMMPLELEFCRPKATPSGVGASLVVRPYDPVAAAEFSNADDVTLRCATDGSSVNFDFRAWTTSTVLVFLRFPRTVSGVDGIIIGAAPDELPVGTGSAVQRMVLQLDGSTPRKPKWDWLEYHA
jgi:hypothetical protein